MHGAIFTEAAVQGDEAARKTIALEFNQVALRRVERVGIDATCQQGLQHAVA